MESYERTETARLEADITNEATGAVESPSTSTKISIFGPDGIVVTGHDEQNMTADGTGDFHYDYKSASDAMLGKYRYSVTGTNGTPVTIKWGEFELVSNS
ncbi:MAG: hypothetical protein KAV00_06880 [Phycisphaerae bacterium]|nr:hypothetical protein [Phycisphaerae bacterium]